MSTEKLSEWLETIRLQHRLEIDLSLGRVREVAEKLGILKLNCPVVTVGGTNGKGSTVAGLEKIWLSAGYRVGAFTSPWLHRFNEIVRIQGEPVIDARFIHAFRQIDLVRGDLTLTQFEFNTLAAFLIFQAENLDVVILEVGLGGRLDAVNIIDADVSVVTTIALDHIDRLGDTREKIGYEKAGIFRTNRPAVCGDFDPPESLITYAKKIGAQFYCQGNDFGFEETGNDWNFWRNHDVISHLPRPSLLLQNMATVLMVIDLLQNRLPVTRDSIIQALQTVHLPGRIEVHPGQITKIFDVSHNPAAAKILADYLSQRKSANTRAVFSMLSDKDILTTIKIMKEVISEWFVAPLDIPRGTPLSRLQEIFYHANVENISFMSNVKEAYLAAQNKSIQNDCIVVFGSFHTVSEVLLKE